MGWRGSSARRAAAAWFLPSLELGSRRTLRAAAGAHRQRCTRGGHMWPKSMDRNTTFWEALNKLRNVIIVVSINALHVS